MLSTIREKTQGLIASAVLGLLAITFALWGVNYYFEGGGNNAVAKVGDTEISQQLYRQTLDQQRQRFAQYPGLVDQPFFKQQILEALIDRALALETAQKAGYRIGDAQLGEQIRAIPAFQKDGKFDPARYRELLARAGLSVPVFEGQERITAQLEQARAGFERTAFVSAAELARVAALAAQRRTIAYLVLKPALYAAKAKPSDQDVKNYYDAHKDRFMQPEQVKVAYLQLSPDNLIRGITVTDAELRKAYADEAARFVAPEERRASHILISVPPNASAQQQQLALAKAEAIRAQLRAGADFAALARRDSQDPGSASKGGDLGYAARGTYTKPFDQALFALKKPGDISAPIKTEFGYHIIKLTGIKPEVRKSFSQVRAELAQSVRSRKAEDAVSKLTDRLQNLAYEHPESLKPAADALGLKIEESGWFSRDGGPGIAANPKVVAAAFDPDVLKQTRNSDAIDAGKDGWVVVRVIGHKPATPKPLSQVRAEIEKTITGVREQEAADEAGSALLARARKGESLEALARASGATWVAQQVVIRDEKKGIDPQLLQAVFRVPHPTAGKPVVGGSSLQGGGYAVFALTAVDAPDPAALKTAEADLKPLMQARDGASYYDEYLAGLRAHVPVKIFKENF